MHDCFCKVLEEIAEENEKSKSADEEKDVEEDKAEDDDQVGCYILVKT